MDQYVFVYLFDKSKIMHKYEGFDEDIDEEYYEYDEDNLLVDRVIKFENLHTELPTVLPFYYPEEKEKSKTTDDVLTDSQKDKIANLYLKDFILFDYYPWSLNVDVTGLVQTKRVQVVVRKERKKYIFFFFVIV